MQSYQKIGNQHFTPSSIAPLCGAECLRPSRRFIKDVQLDSRQCRPGSLFFALTGENSDGFLYLKSAEKLGACAVVVEASKAQKALSLVSCAVLSVKDVKHSLHALAKAYTTLFSQVQTVGITGSCGKSTTKEATAKILSMLGPTAKTEGNLNSEFGLPLSLFSLDTYDRYGVFELGVDHRGEMDLMVDMLKPSVALLTNIGISHLEKFSKQKTIAEEKAKIFHPSVAKGFITRGCNYASLIQEVSPVALSHYSLDDLKADDLGLLGWRISYHGYQFEVRTVGRHLLEDIAGAIAIGEHFGATAADIAAALDGFQPMKGRSSVDTSDITIIDDSYNASLDSMQSILTYISSLSYRGRKKVVLGPMKELGAKSKDAHHQIARILARSSFSTAYLYGKEMEVARNDLKQLGFLGEVHYTDDFQELEEQVTTFAEKGDLFLLKASRSIAMERLIVPLKMQMQHKRKRYA